MSQTEVDPQDLKKMSPIEVDTILASALVEHAKAQSLLEAHEKNIRSLGKRIEEYKDPERMAADPEHFGRRVQDYTGRLEKARGEVEDIKPKAAAAKKVIDACDAEYDTRPWSRFWLVTNTGGHIHRNKSCPTCFPTTQYAFLPDYSGATDEELIAAGGSSICSVCFPDAPVDTWKRASTIEAPDKKAAREEREQAKAEREAKKNAKGIAARDGSPLRVRHGGLIKTEAEAQRIAVQWLAQQKAIEAGLDRVFNDYIMPERLADAATLIDALAFKRGTSVEEQEAELDKKAAAKVKRDYR